MVVKFLRYMLYGAVLLGLTGCRLTINFLDWWWNEPEPVEEIEDPETG